MKSAVEKMARQLDAINLPCSGEMRERFEIYGETLVEWNQKMNLTAIVEPEEIVMKHFYDSLLLLKYLQMDEGSKLIDVGTGAGFPGLPLLIARPDIQLTLLDSTKKRLIFLEEVLKRIGLQAQTVHARGEEAGRHTMYREEFDIATARAVAALPVLSEYCIPFVKRGGRFAAMKGPGFEEECAAAAHAIAELGGRVERVEKFTLPDGSGRTIGIIEKMSQTSSKYPRPSAKIAKKPL